MHGGQRSGFTPELAVPAAAAAITIMYGGGGLGWVNRVGLTWVG